MKFKLDENFGKRTQWVFDEASHDVQTVSQEGLAGVSDEILYDICCREKRCLVTLDLGFADITRFPPGKTAGIVVIRLPRNPSLALLERLVRQFLGGLSRFELRKKLWIVEVGRIRIHQTEEMESF